jgi:HD-GYP domain-containing protein (c-di-GMP phosphodiesterase class II)
MSTFAKIIAIVDSYYTLVSKRPAKQTLLPHEAIEYIMAYSGDLFDTELVQLFARQVPLYPTGITVKLNTGEMGIIINANIGHIGRPFVRICYDKNGRELSEPNDMDLSGAKHQNILIVQVLDY